MKDFRLFRHNSSSSGNNENVPLNPSETLNPIKDPDQLRPPFNPIQEPTPMSRRKPESTVTPSKNIPFCTPEKPTPSVSRNRFGWAPAENSEETSHHLPPLGRYGNGIGTVTPRTLKVTSSKASSVQSESNSTHSTPSKSVTKPGYGISGSRPPVSAGVRVGLVKGLPICSGPVTMVDTPDVPHFELKEDQSFWLDHNVQVVIRVRPLNSNEKSLCGFNRCLKQESSQTITWIGQPEMRFMFDYVACETIDQEMLFRVAGLPMVENCMSGYNSCMFAYGQTGSGKTYTMLGEISDLEVRPSPDRGMTPRIFEFLFARIRAEEESRRDEKLRYNCKCSFLEIYNEQITDLLDPTSTNLLLREDAEKGVYVENLTEYKVDSVHDIITLIVQGSANRRVAATNMNVQSSRSHSVFTCVIESHWEKDSTTNFRFSRLNLVDLAGSERQKTSGAEGERLKEAASINKSLSTLGHVIMVLSDLANGKQKHVPYRDSRLTFLLQDSLGGNSKTMIIANVSPSMCSASETLSTLKFSRRARLIQNNAIVNEDTSGDVLALQRQIRLLKEEVALLKRQNIQRSTLLQMDDSGDLDDKTSETSSFLEDAVDPTNSDKRLSNGSSKSIRLSNKQWKSLEATLAGALRRERAAETTIKQLEAEIEQLKRLVCQREDDTRCTKMMLKFREDKINRMEALVKGEITHDLYLVEDNKALTKEIELLRTRVDRNPEVTRFALENIRLLDQIRRYQDFYEEGERDLLTNEVSQLRNQIMHLIDGKPELEQQLKLTMENQELEHSQAAKLHVNAGSFPNELKMTSEELERCRSDLEACLDVNEKLTREIADLRTKLSATKYGNDDESNEILTEPKGDKEEVLNLQLELDILKAILEEEKSAHFKTGKKTINLETELSNAKSVIESLESQIILLMKELEEVREKNLSKKTESRRLSLKHLQKEDSPLNKKLKKMQASIEMVRNLEPESPLERERDEVRKQAEVATAEVIICLQEELGASQERVEELEVHQVELRAQLDTLRREEEEREREWEVLAHEIASVLSNGNAALEAASDDVQTISGGLWKKDWVCTQIGNLTRGICERDGLIEELNNCLGDAQRVSCDLEWKLRSLRRATLAITEAHQQENREKEREIGMLEEEICRFYLKEEVLLCCFASIQVEMQNVKMLNVELWEKESEIEIAMSEIVSDVSKAKNALEEFKVGVGEIHESEPVFTSEKLVDGVMVSSAETLQKASLVIHLQREIKNLIGSLGEVRALVISQTSMKDKTLLDQIHSVATMQDLKTEVLQLETDFQDKEREFHVKMLEMERKILELEKGVVGANSSWHESREALELELREARARTTQKTLEASNLFMKIEETQKTIQEADATINAFMHANEGLKLQIENYQQAERLLSSQVHSLTSSLDVKEREFELILVLVTELEEGFRHVQSLFLQKFESVSSDIDQVKLDFNHDVSMARELLEGTWWEIIRKDCALSVLNLCQMGILLERVTGLSAENCFLQKGICASNSIVSSLRENNLKAKSELELCTAIKGKLLADINKSFNCISKKEEETEEMKFRINCFGAKIQELQLREEKMLERSNTVHEELGNLIREIEGNKQHVLEAVLGEKELVIQQMVKLTNEREVLFGVIEKVGMEATLRTLDWHLSSCENEMLRDELRALKGKQEVFFQQMIKMEMESDDLCRVSEEMGTQAALKMVDLQLSLLQNTILEDELGELRENHETLSHENSQLRDSVHSSDLFVRMAQEDLNSKIRVIDLLRNELCAIVTRKEIATVGEHLQRIFHSVGGDIDSILNKVNKDAVEQMDMVSKFACELDIWEEMLEKIKTQNSYLHSELNRREQLSEGLLFDLRLLQESTYAAKEEKEEEIEELAKALETIKTELEDRNGEIEALLSEIGEKDHMVETLKFEISELNSRLESSNDGRKELEVKLCEKNWVVVKLEEELLATRNLMQEKGCCVEELSNNLTRLTGELEMANALAEENEALVTEARQIAEERKVYAEEKEEEVKLLENSIQELEATISALENKVDMVKEEAGRQLVQRELLEAELHQVRKQLGNTCGGDVNNQIIELKNNIETLEKELSDKEAEIAQCKGHISELNMLAEAQAREYKQKFRELEAMAQQVKSTESTAPAGPVGSMNQTKNKGTGSPFKGRGSGSPFKCIGLGIIQQVNSEKDEDITALKRRIEELESLASSRQKEIFMLNTRLASAESMTHDVIRDLLGVKMDMASYAKAPPEKMDFVDSEDSEQKEQEIKKLKKRLNEFIEERQGWIDEINQRQAEMLAARVTVEKLREKEQLRVTENEMLKCENEKYKNKVVQLEDEMQRLPTQHNLHLRIHHHAKTKEENNILRKQNQDLRTKLERTESILERVREELAQYRASNGRDPYFDIEEEEQLRQTLQESEDNRLQLAEKLVKMCTSVLKVAGFTHNEADSSPDAAQAALDCIRDHITSLEAEVQDLKLKCRLQSEKERLAELQRESSSVRTKEMYNSPSSSCVSPSTSLS